MKKDFYVKRYVYPKNKSKTLYTELLQFFQDKTNIRKYAVFFLRRNTTQDSFTLNS